MYLISTNKTCVGPVIHFCTSQGTTTPLVAGHLCRALYLQYLLNPHVHLFIFWVVLAHLCALFSGMFNDKLSQQSTGDTTNLQDVEKNGFVIFRYDSLKMIFFPLSHNKRILHPPCVWPAGLDVRSNKDFDSYLKRMPNAGCFYGGSKTNTLPAQKYVFTLLCFFLLMQQLQFIINIRHYEAAC